ncbi:hypothetical protein GQ600_25508 [Phytophthora cactorum]|nr:hypothetical protein GQ600_25508 [Phytophthora cactorum]
MTTLQRQHCIRLLDAAPSVDRNMSFNAMLDDATAKVRYRSKVTELAVLEQKLMLPVDGVTTSSGKI